MNPPPFDPVAAALDVASGGTRRWTSFVLRPEAGTQLPLDVARWMDPPDGQEEGALSRAMEPVLDVGCGPGRHTIALAQRGVGAIGLDEAPAAVRLASRRGAPVLLGSIFDPVPGASRWGTVLLLDGNVGIGGDPRRLLRRVRRLLRPGGRVLIELDPDEPRERSMLVEVVGDGTRLAGARFPWAVVGPDVAASLAAATGFRLIESWGGGARWFARLDAI